MTAGSGGLLLTADCGNTRAKLALWAPEGEGWRAVEAFAFVHARSGARAGPRPGAGEEPGAWLARHPAPERAGVSSVASAPATEALLDLLGARVGRVVLAPEPGLANETDDPPGVGSDRLYAARGALALVGRSALVVDAGTALTVDAVVAAAGGRGRFLGGAIAPGPALLARALSAEGGGGSRLPLVELGEPGAVRALGRDTAAAIRSGVLVGLRGAARALVAEVAREAGLGPYAPVVLTGGAAALLDDGLAAGRPLARDPDLVHRGLLAALLDEGGGDAGRR